MTTKKLWTWLAAVIIGSFAVLIYFPCTHGTKSVLSLGTQHHKTQQKLVETISFNELLLP
jgi:accessory gene regulator protein AgrB